MRKTHLALVALAVASIAALPLLGASAQQEGQKATKEATAQQAGDDQPGGAKERRTEKRSRREARRTEDPTREPARKETYLGIAVEPVPPVLVAHLPERLSRDQGLLVVQVAPDSPAAKAGLQEHDILVEYDDQKLFSAEQLIKVVRGDKAGRSVTLGVVRGGKLEKITAALGERDARPGPRRGFEDLFDPHAAPGRMPMRLFLGPDAFGRAPGSDKETREQFTSMTLRSLDGDRFRAEIEYKSESGEKKEWSFEGTREEIRKELDGAEEMPEGIREQMRRSLDFSGRGRGGFRFMMPRPGLFLDGDQGQFQWFGPGAFSLDFEDMLDRLSEDLDPKVREELQGKLRSLEEQPQKRPILRDRSL